MNKGNRKLAGLVASRGETWSCVAGTSAPSLSGIPRAPDGAHPLEQVEAAGMQGVVVAGCCSAPQPQAGPAFPAFSPLLSPSTLSKCLKLIPLPSLFESDGSVVYCKSAAVCEETKIYAQARRICTLDTAASSQSRSQWAPGRPYSTGNEQWSHTCLVLH